MRNAYVMGNAYVKILLERRKKKMLRKKRIHRLTHVTYLGPMDSHKKTFVFKHDILNNKCVTQWMLKMTAQNLESNVTDCVARALPWLVCHTRTALLLVDSQQRHFLSDIFMQKQIVVFYFYLSFKH